mmetsp:Transcript_55242/g.103573  ORF Transcript_55242/g.103573 Transcript_55242/m.103573 type:complete len:207 (-) Transcript_55242:107-727(-)
MPAFDYWDLDEILAEEQEVTMKSYYDIMGGGVLYPSSGSARQKDLREGIKVAAPFYLAHKLARRNVVDVDVPAVFDNDMQESLQTDPLVCRLGDKSHYYFEAGMKIASLLKNSELQEILVEALRKRWCEIVNLTGTLADPSAFNSAVTPVHGIFPQTLTGLEEDLYRGSREAETHFRRWCHSFSFHIMEPSHTVEMPSTKRVRLNT